MTSVVSGVLEGLNKNLDNLEKQNSNLRNENQDLAKETRSFRSESHYLNQPLIRLNSIADETVYGFLVWKNTEPLENTDRFVFDIANAIGSTLTYETSTTDWVSPGQQQNHEPNHGTLSQRIECDTCSTRQGLLPKTKAIRAYLSMRT